MKSFVLLVLKIFLAYLFTFEFNKNRKGAFLRTVHVQITKDDIDKLNLKTSIYLTSSLTMIN